tara:strand:+ start:3453 stop:4634 length:1182 start_codon:yes stop_codon:yes gene_type:complete
MAKKEKEEPKVDNEVGSLKVKEKVEKQPDGNETKGNVTKVKEKMKKPSQVVEKTITKVDLSKPTPEEAVEKVEEPQVEETAVVETPVLEEVTNEEKVEEIADVVEEALVETIESGIELPENIQKLMDFMDETGGDLNDYVTLNQDYSELDNHTLLKEYYKSTKPHLSEEEVDFVMEDTFAYDEDMDEDKEIKRKKLAMKEQVAQAKQHLESVKSKYYEDIKSGSKLTEEQQKAVNFFNRYNEESEQSRKMGEKQSEIFRSKSDQVFNENFKGFEYSVGDKKFRFNVKDKQSVRETQGDINNFIRKFLTEDNMIEDAAGYHKGLFTAMNPDQVANHFYEQGKADALKESIAKSKNVNMDPRQAHVENVNTSGFTARALNDDGPDFKFRIKNKNK